MLWLYLLAAVTVLVIALRRVVRAQAPLTDELYSNRVAVEHVYSGVAWIRHDGMVGSVNQALADEFGGKSDLLDHEWYLMFPAHERPRVKDAYTQMLLAGIANLDTMIESADGGNQVVHLRMIAVHDHKMRLVGHHCIFHNSSRERALERQIQQLSVALADVGYELTPAEKLEQAAKADSL